MIRGEAASRAVEASEPQQVVTERSEVAPRAGLALGEVRGGRRVRSARDPGRRLCRPAVLGGERIDARRGLDVRPRDDDRPELPGREQLVGPCRVTEPRIGEEPEDLAAHVPGQVPGLDLAPGQRVEHGPGLRVRAGDHEGQPEVAAIRVEPGVDPGDVGIEDRARLGRERSEIPFRRLPPAEGPDEPVLLERARPEQLGEASGRDAPPDLHLPHPFLGVDIPLGNEQVVRRGRGDVGETGRVAVHGDGRVETRDVERARGLWHRAVGDPDQRTRPGRHADDDHDEQDDDHPLQEPHGCPPTLNRGVPCPDRPPRPAGRSHRRRRRPRARHRDA